MSLDLTSDLEGIVHEPTQTEGPGLDLTLADVYEIEDPGRVDFGGGELEAAGRTSVSTTVRNPDDDYEWYYLPAGQYLLAFNERFAEPGGDAYWLQTRAVLREAGAFHPSLRVRELNPVPFSVGGAGIRLKENARVSTLYPL